MVESMDLFLQDSYPPLHPFAHHPRIIEITSSFPPGFIPTAPSVRSARDTPRTHTNAFPVPPPSILDNAPTPRGVRTSIYAGQGAPYIPGSCPSRVYPSGPSMPGTPAAGAHRLSGIYNGNPPLPESIRIGRADPPLIYYRRDLLRLLT